MNRNPLRDALAACADLLGADRVCIDHVALAQVNAATFLTAATAPAILKPINREQVAACLRIANQYRVPVYPVSAGKNWGYGSAVAPRDGCILLSLASLTAIVDFDAQTGHIRLEPGVSFQQLHTYLQERSARFQAPHTGSGAQTSVIGNIMERGIGKGLYEDMTAHVHACEAVLANGEILKTSQDASGPHLWGLLPQSNLAIVVEITLQLEPAPHHSQLITFPIDGGAAALLRAVRGLHNFAMRAGPRSQLAFLNDYRITSQLTQFPHEHLDARAALPREWMQHCLAPWRGAQWVGACTVWADDIAELDWRRNRLTVALHEMGLAPQIETPIECLQLALDDDGLRCAYWRKTFPMPRQPDLDRDRCGVIWVAPILPLSVPRLDTLIADLETLTLAHGFEPAIALRTGRTASMRLILGLFFDRDLPGADTRALQCHQALHVMLQKANVQCYRHTLVDTAMSMDVGTRSVLTALKTQIDPHGILAPGRYGLS